MKCIRWATIFTVVVMMVLAVSVEASDKYGGGSSGGSSSGGSRNYSANSSYSNGYRTTTYNNGNRVDVTNTRTGETRSYMDYNRDGDFSDSNERTSSNMRDGGDGGNGWRGTTTNRPTTGTPTTNPLRCLLNPRSCQTSTGSNPTPSSCVASSGTACTSATNYCGQTTAGTRSCTGVCSVSAAPSNATCTNFPLGPGGVGGGDGLTVNPVVVRPGDPVTVTWDVGPSNLPANCTLTGTGIPAGFQLTGRTGSYPVASVTGPHQYTLRCGTAATTEGIRVLPVMYES